MINACEECLCNAQAIAYRWASHPGTRHPVNHAVYHCRKEPRSTLCSVS